MNEGRVYWLVSVPKAKTGDDTFGELTRLAVAERDVAVSNYRFDIPELRVGNMDTLVSLTDDLKKMAMTVDSTLKKIATQYFDLHKTQEGASGDKPPRRLEIEVRGSPMSSDFSCSVSDSFP